jgi:hypothetical protein
MASDALTLRAPTIQYRWRTTDGPEDATTPTVTG